MRIAEIGTSVILIAISVLVVYEANRLGFGWGLEGPQPGFFIFGLGAGLAACSLVNLCRVFFDGAVRWQRFFPAAAWIEVLRVLVPMAGAIFLMEFFGFYIASAVYLAFFMRWVGDFSWKMVVVVAFVFAFTHYVVFEKWFLVPLPKGLLEPYIGL